MTQLEIAALAVAAFALFMLVYTVLYQGKRG